MWAFFHRFKVREHERGLLFKDGEFKAVLRPGRHFVWDPLRKVRLDVVSVRDLWLDHRDLDVVVKSGALGDEARVVDLKDHERAVVWMDGRIEAVLKPGLYALWTVFHAVRVEVFDARAVRFEHAELPVIAPAKGAVALLESVLDVLLSDKDAVARELDGLLRVRVAGFGLEVVALGIRDVILPGEMKDLMNKVTEAKKAAEAALITRREETAAMRSQANTAKILESSPTLMRLRELEVLEKVSEKANLTVVLGDKGLADRVVKLL